MKSNWNATLERWTRCIPRKSRIMVQAAVVENSDVVSTKDGWGDADALTNLTAQDDGSLIITSSISDKITHETQDGYLTDLNNSTPFSVAQIEWAGSDPEDFEIQKVQAWLHPKRTGAAKTVARWGCQIKALQRVEDEDLLAIIPLGNTVWVDEPEGGVVAHEVTFDFSGQYYKPRPKMIRPDDPYGGYSHPTTFVHIYAVTSDGAPADNCGWGKDSAQTSVTTDSNVLKGMTLTEMVAPDLKGLFQASDTSEVPYITIQDGTVAQQTVEFTTNDFDLGAVPSSADEVRFVVQGSELSGTTLTASARVPAGSYVEVTDGMTATDAGLAANQTYEMRCVLDPDSTGVVSPILRRLGVEDVAITDLTTVADVKEIHRQVDPITLKSYVTAAKITAIQDGIRDFNDAITTLLSESFIGEIQFRIYLGHSDLDREYWMSLGTFLEPTYNAVDGAIELTAVSPLALVRATLPKYDTGTNTRSPLTYAGTTLKATYEDLLDGQVELAGRFRGPGIEDGTTTVSRYINDELDAKDMLDAIAYLDGSAVGESQGLVQTFDLYGDKAVVAVFPSQSIEPVYVTPGYEERLPEWTVKHNWSEDERRYTEERYYAHASSLTNLGTAAMNDRREMDDAVAKWITSTALADTVGQKAVDLFGAGLLRLGFSSVYAYPELEVGDMVAVETDRFVAVDPTTSNAVKGRLWVLAVIVDHDALGENFVVWVRGYEDIFSSANAGTITVGLKRFRVNVHHDSDQAIGIAANVDLSFDNESEDVGEMHDKVTNNSRLTVPTGGKGTYTTKARIVWNNVTYDPARDVTFAFSVNGTNVAETTMSIDTSAIASGVALMAADLNLEDGDYVELNAVTPSAGSGSCDILSNSVGDETAFWMTRRGA